MVELVSEGAEPEQRRVGRDSEGTAGGRWPGPGGPAPLGSHGRRSGSPGMQDQCWLR